MDDPLPSRKTWRARLDSVATCLALTLFGAGLIVRLTVQDRILVANTIYYATPWSILCVLGGFCSWRLRSRGVRKRHLAALAIAAAGCGVAWSRTSWFHLETEPAPSDIRVMTWNLGHGNLGLRGLAEAAASLDPDVAVFIEADPRQTDVRAVFQAAFPEKHVFLLGGGIVLVSRWPGGEARAYEIGSDKTETRIREIELTTPFGEWTVFACDIASQKYYQREPHLRELARRAGLRKNPVIIAGDFNTPMDSVHLDLLRNMGLAEAFETAGSGYQPTWPVPCPVLSLDQIWLDARLHVVSGARRWSWRSDHAAVIALVRPTT